MKKFIFIVTLVLVAYLHANAQGYADNWAIANTSGINFSAGIPVFFSTNTHHSFFAGNSSLASISNRGGVLQFYYTEDSIFDNNNVMIENGFDLVYNNQSYGFSSCIIPNLNNDSVYYLIHAGTYHDNLGISQYGLFYSKINMSLNNGAGKVVLKTIVS